ncbi:MAG: DUF1572 family protein [Gemmatimonadetes bacterium]|jgi:uncharacterized damage-inducible protein DinB|nr:DUF1572 family protein [Gemmatimonadota bacterium]MBP9105126.1 DUF1572 family protein [Gemmatimonadaceae bacterium]MBK6843094.1 DUF1572 family protein [Gemmatimonadota bacterium]MBK7831560.1 DUF1572 family protein [Gemmatimonadota bacterium]MBK8059725.1 DUF1572 family protein [Gemmatimonadota bacterium]
MNANLLKDFSLIFARELTTLRAEVLSYPDDASIWALPAGAPNAGGTLVLHLCGNLRHFIGAGLGASGYVRDRDAEFSTRGTSRAELATLIHFAAAEVALALDALPAERLDDTIQIGPSTIPVRRGLLHLASHLAYHIGQLDYHRRLVTGDSRGVGAMGLPPQAD